MSLQQFKSAFGGHEVTILCQYLAVANGNQSLHSITVSQSEVKRYIAGWHGGISQYSYPQWSQLTEEIYQLLDNRNKDPHKIKRQVFRILMQLKEVAPYFFHTNNGSTTAPKSYIYGIKGIEELFGCSHATAQHYKDTILAPAVPQNGRKIVVDLDHAMQLFGQNKKEARK